MIWECFHHWRFAWGPVDSLHKWPVMPTDDVFFGFPVNTVLNKQWSWCAVSLMWHHCYDMGLFYVSPDMMGGRLIQIQVTYSYRRRPFCHILNNNIYTNSLKYKVYMTILNACNVYIFHVFDGYWWLLITHKCNIREWFGGGNSTIRTVYLKQLIMYVQCCTL